MYRFMLVLFFLCAKYCLPFSVVPVLQSSSVRDEHPLNWITIWALSGQWYHLNVWHFPLFANQVSDRCARSDNTNKHSQPMRLCSITMYMQLSEMYACSRLVPQSEFPKQLTNESMDWVWAINLDRIIDLGQMTQWQRGGRADAEYICARGFLTKRPGTAIGNYLLNPRLMETYLCAHRGIFA